MAKKSTAQAWAGNPASVVTFYGAGENAFALASALVKKAKDADATSIVLSVDYIGSEKDDLDYSGSIFVVR